MNRKITGNKQRLRYLKKLKRMRPAAVEYRRKLRERASQ